MPVVETNQHLTIVTETTNDNRLDILIQPSTKEKHKIEFSIFHQVAHGCDWNTAVFNLDPVQCIHIGLFLQEEAEKLLSKQDAEERAKESELDQIFSKDGEIPF